MARGLREVINWALQELGAQAGHQVALGAADLLDRGNWRLMTDVSVSRDGEPLPDTLFYRVEVEVSNGWVELVEARWSALGVSEESARDDAKWTAMQNGLGVPDDLSGLDSPFLSGRRTDPPAPAGRLAGVHPFALRLTPPSGAIDD